MVDLAVWVLAWPHPARVAAGVAAPGQSSCWRGRTQLEYLRQTPPGRLAKS
jgi:hypothetical protein